MASFFRAAFGYGAADPSLIGGVEFWSDPERSGWLSKQREHIETWRRRWFVLKQGKLFWFKDSDVTRASVPRGVVPVSYATCRLVECPENALKFGVYVPSLRSRTIFFIADSKREKAAWIDSITRAQVQLSRSFTDVEVVDYDYDSSKNREKSEHQLLRSRTNAPGLLINKDSKHDQAYLLAQPPPT